MHAHPHLHPTRRRGPGRAARAVLLAGVACAALTAPASAAVPAGTTTLIDRPSGDAALSNDGLSYSILSTRQSMSADGNRVVFESDADALHAGEGDKTERYVYVRDRAAGTTTNLCRSSAGVLGNQGCNEIGISPNGRYVVFRSTSTNLTSLGGSSMPLVYRRDLQTGVTELMSRATGVNGAVVSSGYIGIGTSVSDDGTVVFPATASLSPADTGNARPDVYARVGNETRLLSKTSGNVIGNGASEYPTISGDGTVVAFESDATNFGTDTNGKRDVFWTPISGAFTPSLGSRRTAVNDSGNGDSRGPSLSHNGGRLAFTTAATNLFSTPITTDANGVDDIVLRDINANTNTAISIGAGNAQANGFGAYSAVVSSDGSKVAFAGAIPAFGSDGQAGATFVRNVAGGTTALVSRNNGGAVIDGGSAGGVTNDGGVVAFGGHDDAAGFDEAQVFVRLTGSNQTQTVSIPSGAAPEPPFATNGWAGRGAVTTDGGHVVFTSRSPAVTGKPFDGYRHALLRDVRTGSVRVLDATPSGAPGAGDTDGVVISADGSRAAFVSYADDLHPEAGGDEGHLFVVDLKSGAISVVDRSAGGQVVGGLGEPDLSLSDDGSRLAFTTEAKLDPADTNTHTDAYVRDLSTGAITLASRRDGADGAATANDVWSVVLSGNGKRVGFTSADPNLVGGDGNGRTDAFVRDLAGGTTEIVSRVDGAGGAAGNGNSWMSDLSADGTRAAFTSSASNLGNGDPDTDEDVHVRDLGTGQTIYASRPAAGGEANSYSGSADLSADGTRVAFGSRATNLVLPDANAGEADVYLRDLGSGAVSRIGLSTSGAQPVRGVYLSALSADGHCAVLESRSPDLVDGGYPSPDYEHVYLRAIDAACASPLPVKEPEQKGPETGQEQRPAADKTAPSLSKLALTRQAFATKGKKKGSTLSFSLSEPATVKLTVSTTKPGKTKGKSCVKPRKAKRKAKRCVIVGTPKDLQVVKAAAGKNTVAITGWAKGKRLPKGTYRLLLVATDAAGNRSAAPVFIDFRIK